MKHFFVPYQGQAPATISVKGHNFLILSRDRQALNDCLELFGADRICQVVTETTIEEDTTLDELARLINGGIVMTPIDVLVSEILDNLESELPWLH